MFYITAERKDEVKNVRYYCVVDSRDGIEEWYDLDTLKGIVEESGIEINEYKGGKELPKISLPDDILYFENHQSVRVTLVYIENSVYILEYPRVQVNKLLHDYLFKRNRICAKLDESGLMEKCVCSRKVTSDYFSNLYNKLSRNLEEEVMGEIATDAERLCNACDLSWDEALARAESRKDIIRNRVDNGMKNLEHLVNSVSSSNDTFYLGSIKYNGDVYLYTKCLEDGIGIYFITDNYLIAQKLPIFRGAKRVMLTNSILLSIFS